MDDSDTSQLPKDAAEYPGSDEDALKAARQVVEAGDLGRALEILSQLPFEHEEAAGLRSLVENRQRKAGILLDRTVDCIEQGNKQEAMECLLEAERIWPANELTRELKKVLGETERESAAFASTGSVTDALETLGSTDFTVARLFIEKAVREHGLSEELQQAVRKFKRSRARGCFLDNVRQAKRLYLLGHTDESCRHWLKAGDVLPAGPAKDKLMSIVQAAKKGTLSIDPDRVAAEQAQAEQAQAEQEAVSEGAPESLSAAAEADQAVGGKRRPILLFLVSVLLGGILGLLFVLSIMKLLVG